MNREEIRRRKQEICDYYKNLLDNDKEIFIADIAKKFKTSRTTIYNALAENNLKLITSNRNVINKENIKRDKEILDLYSNSKMTLDAIGKKYGISKQRVLQIVRSNGVEKRLKTNRQVKYNESEVIFDGLRLWLNKNNMTKSDFLLLLGSVCKSSSQLSAILRGTVYVKKPFIDKVVEVTKLPYEFCFRISEEVKGLTAKWLINSDGYYPYCSNCSYEPKTEVIDLCADVGDIHICPNCGARIEK